MACVTHVIHLAWPVHFKLPLSSYEAQMVGVRRLIDLCAQSDHRIRVFCTSTYSVAHNWNTADGSFPESCISDPSVSCLTGYSASKYVLEQVSLFAMSNNRAFFADRYQIVDRAWARGIEITCIRIGQVCGSRATGAWAPTEWFPMIVITSAHLGLVPDFPNVRTTVPETNFK